MPRVGKAAVSDADSRLAELERLIEDELLRRLQDPKAAAELPAHSLARLYDSVTKAKKPDEKEEDTVEQDILEILENTDLPADRKLELITKERERLNERIDTLGKFV